MYMSALSCQECLRHFSSWQLQVAKRLTAHSLNFKNGRKSVIPGLPITDALRSHIVQHLYSFFFYALKWSCCKLWVTTEQQKPCPCVFRVLAAAGGTFFKSSDQFVSFIWCPAQQLWKIYKKKPVCLMSDMMEVNETLAVTKLPNSEWIVIGWDLLILRQIPSS